MAKKANLYTMDITRNRNNKRTNKTIIRPDFDV